MSIIGTVDALWRYPVKSMRGEEIDAAFVGFPGIYGDRIYAFTSSDGRAGFPYFTARVQREMLRYRPRFRNPEAAVQPPNLLEAQRLGPGITPLYATLDDLVVDVETPSGDVLAIDDPALVRALDDGDERTLSLVRSERALTDCRPVSLISLQTVRQLGVELDTEMDRRRYRANVYLDLPTLDGFAEDGLVGRSLRLGSQVVVSVLERDPRCMMITLDPDTGEATPSVHKHVAQAHENKAGVYGAVLVEGIVRPGDAVELLG